MKPFDQDDPVWKLLGASRRVEPNPFFSRNVVREVRQLQADGRADHGGFWVELLSLFRQPAFAGAAAAAAVLAAISLSTMPVSDGWVAEPVAAAADFDPTEEIESIGYLGELMAISDPADLDDAALADLYLLASR